MDSLSLENISDEFAVFAFIGIAIILFMIITFVKVLMAIDAVLSLNKNVKRILEHLEAKIISTQQPQTPQKPVNYNNEINEHPSLELKH